MNKRRPLFKKNPRRKRKRGAGRKARAGSYSSLSALKLDR